MSVLIKREVPSEASLDIKIEQEQSKVSNLKMYKYTPLVVQEQGKEYYQKIMQMSYDELVQYLINKYGPAKFDYFTNESCTAKNKNVTRTSEGLVCHHIDEDKAINLSTVEYAAQNPFEYQKANRLVYCNLLEHFLLHILIAEEPKNINANQNEIQGIGGAICFICKQLNDIYNGYKYDQQWFINIACKVKNDYDSYIMMLKRLWNLVQNNKILSNFVTKEDLAVGFSKVLYQQILNELQ